jgi:LAO/AO transport system kinase
MSLVVQARNGNRRALARLITVLENGGAAAQAFLQELYPFTGGAQIIGLTGAPGTGKSTLVSALARIYLSRGLRVGIIAVDPTSPFTGGALLGDRVRMRELAGLPDVFIRSMATRGSLGGLARSTSDVALALDAAGFQRVLVETVGVGQAEVDIASMAHSTVVIEAPGLGDEVQAIKAGVLEIGDLLVVNKADREGVDREVQALRMMQGLAGGSDRYNEPGAQPDGAWLAPVLKTVALTGDGVREIAEWLEMHAAYLHSSGHWERSEVARAHVAVEHALKSIWFAQLTARLAEGELTRLAIAVAQREMDPWQAAHLLLSAASSDSQTHEMGR